MKKYLSVLMSLALIITSISAFSMEAFASEEQSFTGPNDSDHAYLDFHSNGEDYCFYFMGNIGDAKLDGVSYDLDTNTLTLTDYNESSTIIMASEMGSDFKILVNGENKIKGITVLADKYMGSLTIDGDGSLSINEDKEYDSVPLYLDANYTDSVLEIKDSVKLSVCTYDVSVKVNNSLKEDNIISNNTEYRISKYEESYSQAKWITACDTQMNEFSPVKDSDSYTTLVYDNRLGDTFYYEFELFNKSIDGKDVVIAVQKQDDMGNPIVVDRDSIINGANVNACQLLDEYERAVVEKTDDDTEYTLTEYTIGEENTFWDVHKIVNIEGIGQFFYPVAVELTEKPIEYTPVIENIENNYTYIEDDFTNVAESVCEHNYVPSIGAYPQCEIEGSMDYECSICHHTYFEPIPANGHKYDDGVVTTPATCTTDGVITYKCNACEKTATDVINATGHNFGKNEKSCIVCGKSNPDYVENKPVLKSQKITTAKIKNYKASSLKKKSVKISLKAKTNGKGKLTYKVTKYPKNMKKFISVSKKGVVTLKKKAKKGTYSVTITAAAKGNYKKTTKVVSIKVK